MYPNLKTLTRAFGVEKAKQLRAELTCGCDSYANVDTKLEQCDRVLGTHGVEAIRDGQWHPYYCDIGVLYCNAGDPYATTILYDTRAERWIVGCLGDLVERQEKRFAV